MTLDVGTDAEELPWPFLREIAQVLQRADIRAEALERSGLLPMQPCDGARGIAVRAWPLLGRDDVEVSSCTRAASVRCGPGLR